MSYCTKCEDPLPADGTYVNCFACDSTLHHECSGLKATTYAGMSQERKDAWKCKFCRLAKKVADNIYDRIDVKLEPVVQRMLQPMNDQLDSFNLKLNAVAEKQQEFEIKIKSFGQGDSGGQADNETIKSLAVKVNKFQQEKLRKELVIMGVDERRDEDLLYVLDKITKRMKININREDIKNIERMKINKKNETLKNRPIIVKL